MAELEEYYDKKVNNNNLKWLKLQATELKTKLNYDTTLNTSFDLFYANKSPATAPKTWYAPSNLEISYLICTQLKLASAQDHYVV